MPLEDMNEFTARILGAVNAHMMLSQHTASPQQGELLSAIQEWVKRRTLMGRASCWQTPLCGPKPGAEFDEHEPKT